VSVGAEAESSAREACRGCECRCELKPASVNMSSVKPRRGDRRRKPESTRGYVAMGGSVVAVTVGCESKARFMDASPVSSFMAIECRREFEPAREHVTVRPGHSRDCSRE
jgi:hypothetical protein